MSKRDAASPAPARRLGSKAICRPLIGGVAAVATLLLAACGSSSSGTSPGASTSGSASGSPTLSLTVGVTQESTAGLPLHVALDEGFFQKNGLNVTLKNLASPTTELTGLGKGYDVVGGFTPAEIVAVQQGLPIVVISGDSIDSTKNPSTFVEVKKNAGINSLKDLAGKTIGSAALNGTLYYGFLAAMNKVGVSKGQLKGVVVLPAASQDELASGKVDAIVASQPYIAQMSATGTMKDLGDPMPAVSDPAYLYNYAATKSWADANSETVTRFQTALSQAMTWITANHAGAVTEITKFLHMSMAVANESSLPGYSTEFPKSAVSSWETVLQTINKKKFGVTWAQMTADMDSPSS